LVKDGVVEGVNDDKRKDSGTANGSAMGGMGKVVRVVFIAAYIFPAKRHIDQKDFVGPDNPGFTIDVRSMLCLSTRCV